ncbi:MAG TPA: pseudouridine synthase [Chitinophagaceae bacterium]|nr:pseudouridine synthase [Chitinophagaceae bacterium]
MKKSNDNRRRISSKRNSNRETSNSTQKNKSEEREIRHKKTYKKNKNKFKIEEQMPLNKYISRAGICSRRDAVSLIKEGKIKVNNTVVLEPGYKVQSKDRVSYQDKIIREQQELVYILLNKPKGYITTTDDPKGRRTVMDLFRHSIKQRIYPVGRLDRNTTGLLLLTNDGELTQKLAHPKYEIKKIYQVTLDKAISSTHIQAIKKGLVLEDGPIEVDAVSVLDENNIVGIELHSGRNRIVRRIFESLGYDVKHLDRVVFADLTKKNLPRGKWRMLTKQEVINLKFIK